MSLRFLVGGSRIFNTRFSRNSEIRFLLLVKNIISLLKDCDIITMTSFDIRADGST